MAERGVCVCGHGRDAHQHFRPGSDCGACGAQICARYRPTRTVGSVLTGLLNQLRRRRP